MPAFIFECGLFIEEVLRDEERLMLFMAEL